MLWCRPIIWSTCQAETERPQLRNNKHFMYTHGFFGVLLGVVPSLLGPLQALLLTLPLIVMGVTLAARSLTNPLAWREGFSRLVADVQDRPLKSCGYLLLAVALPFVAWWVLQPVGGSTPALDPTVAEGNWPTFHGNAARTGIADLSGVGLEVELAWKYRDALILDRRPFASSPALVGDRVLIGSDNFNLYCLSLEDGLPLWTFEARHPIFSSPVAFDGRVYVGEGLHYTHDAKLYCLDVATGEVFWDFQTTSHTESTPAVSNGKVYFGAGDDGLYCLDAQTGRLEWRFPNAHVDGGPLVHNGHVYFGSGYDTKALFCVDAIRGRLAWRKDFAVPVWGAPATADGRLYVGVGNGNFEESDEHPQGAALCLDPGTGEEVWRFDDVKDGVLTSIAVSDNRAVFGSRDGTCYALDATTGQLVWRADLEVPLLSSPAIAAKHVMLGTDDGLLFCLHLKDGHEVWSYATNDDLMVFGHGDARIQSSPAVVQGQVIFGSSNGNVYCLARRGANKIAVSHDEMKPRLVEQDGDSARAAVAQSQHRSRLMRTADYLTVGLVKQLAWATGSFGWAILLTALALKLVLLPIAWKQSRQQARFQRLQPELERLRREYIDYRIHRFELRRLFQESEAGALSSLGLVLLQIPLLIVVLLVVQSTSVFAGEAFLWISDLSTADRAAQIPVVPMLGSELNLLPFVLAISVWVFSLSLGRPGNRGRLFARLVWLSAAIGLGLLTYRWSAALQILSISLLWIGIVESRLFGAGNQPARRVISEV